MSGEHLNPPDMIGVEIDRTWRPSDGLTVCEHCESITGHCYWDVAHEGKPPCGKESVLDSFPDDVMETVNSLFEQIETASSAERKIVCKANMAEAILAERERCAAVVENTAMPHEIRTRIAADIREGIEP